MLIYFVRHAESTANAARILPDDLSSSPSLTTNGVAQAKELALVLRNIGIEAVYSSPMLRAKETASYISESVGLSIKIDERLRELGLGSLAGKSYIEISSADPEWHKEMYYSYNKYGLEKFKSAMERMLSFIKDLHSAGYKRALAVSHLEPIRAVIACGLNDDGTHVWEMRLDNASISIISYDGSRVRVKCVNWLPLSHYDS